ncbi:bacillithiol system redox-active protein YtxJ [Natronincola ferrireducens]|uniref:Bacillithiol system protein YtxJ n=1 Tax=Natronincola ferrireducens TaxID=393762 RepID=A0A1G9DYB8_9FIRM|nr:bacillithiol system redox-active protein YtxJ [Natronincola ferrireducens]SDK68833.1 bacillithiol system protein YtxJ [Natronincola ferrireducens]
MARRLKKIMTLDDLDKFIKRSNKKPVFIFKHDEVVSESEEAYQQYLQFVEESEEDVLFTMVDVRECVEISEEIEEKLEISHEVPQLMLIMDEEVVWDDQKNNITFDNLIEVVDEYISI